MELKEANCRLHTQEVTGSSPVAPTISSLYFQSFANLLDKLYQNCTKTDRIMEL